VPQSPDRPLAALIGGAKISSKMGMLEHLLDVADEFLIGGGMANTLLKAEGVNVGASLVEDEQLDVAREFLAAARQKRRAVYLPEDVVIAQAVDETSEPKTVSARAVPKEWSIVDIGAATVDR